MDIQYCIYPSVRVSHSLAIKNNTVLCQVFCEHIFKILFSISLEGNCRIIWQFYVYLIKKKNYFSKYGTSLILISKI